MKEIAKVNEAVEYIMSQLGDHGCDLAIVIGPNKIEYETIKEITYGSIPHFPLDNYKWGKGKIVLAEIRGRKVIMLNGCFHLYEGYNCLEIIRPIRVLKGIGIKKIVLTNYSGAVNTEFESGEIMLINDHINLSGDNPLKGPDSLDFGPRFPFMEQAYSLEMQDVIREAAISLELPLNEGVYIKFFGPSYETPAEVRIARAVGADAIGMGLVFECIAAVQCGMEVAGISCISNMAAGISKEQEDKQQILDTCISRLSLLITAIIDKI